MNRQLSAITPHITTSGRSVLTLSQDNGKGLMTHRPIPAPEPNPEPNPEPDGVPDASHSNIATADWDDLFHAVTARLEGCVNHPQGQLFDGQLPEAASSTKTTVLQCVSALNQLHAALVRERQMNTHRES